MAKRTDITPAGRRKMSEAGKKKNPNKGFGANRELARKAQLLSAKAKHEDKE